MTLKRQTAAQMVANELRRRIVGGDLAAGTPLRQEALASELGVSRIPVREALKQLETEGFVVLKSHRSAVVAELSLADIDELFELRALLETWVFGLAIPRLGDADLARAEDYLARMRAGADADEWGTLNWGFHEALYAPSQRQESIRILHRLHVSLDRFVRLQIALTAGQERANVEHEELLDLARRGDVTRAIRALETHIRGVHETLLAGLRGEHEG